jgi:hypothetical protein
MPSNRSLSGPAVDDAISGYVDGDPWADPTATGLRGWADLSGQWRGWPSSMPPAGYEEEWSTVVNVHIEDDHGHIGHGSCSHGLIPSGRLHLICDVLFTQ